MITMEHKHKWIFTGFKNKKTLSEWICFCGELREVEVKPNEKKAQYIPKTISTICIHCGNDEKEHWRHDCEKFEQEGD